MATATGAGKAGTAVVDQAAVDRLVEQNAVLQGERDAAVAELGRLANEHAEPEPEPAPTVRRSVVELIAQASKDIGAIGKDKQMTTGSGYAYRSIEAIAEKAQPKFADLGIVLVPHRITDLAYEDVTNNNGTHGRHYLGRWLWRVYGPQGDFIELETSGECAEWGGDKGAAKATTSARKAAMVAALCLAENSADPDTYASQEYSRAGRVDGYGGSTQAAPPAEMPAGLTKSQQARWLWEQQQRQKAGGPAPTPAPTPAPRPTPEPEQEAVTHASRDPEPSALAAATAEADAEAAQTREELRERMAAITGTEPASAPAEAPQTGQDGSSPDPAPDAPAPAPEASEGSQEPRGYWPCKLCGEVVSGHIGDPCPVCRKGELFDGRRADDEPF